MNMKYTLCKIKPRAPFHLGEKESVLEYTSEYIHSDTLFSAICNAFRLLYGTQELNELLSSFKSGKIPFLVSSAFPFTSKTLFFPLPKFLDISKYVENIKKFKKLEFVSETIFRKIIEGLEIKEFLKEDCLIQDNRILITDKEIESVGKSIWKIREVPRVVIDRKTNASQIYHFGEAVYSKDSGLHFLIDFKTGDFEKEIKSALYLLGDEGIGGDRTYGKGLFKINFEKISFDLSEQENFVTLSLYYPRKEEITYIKNGFYEILGRDGWIYSQDNMNMRRRFIRMFTEGSTFQSHKGTYGDLVKVNPIGFEIHDVYRYGYAFPLPIKVIE